MRALRRHVRLVPETDIPSRHKHTGLLKLRVGELSKAGWCTMSFEPEAVRSFEHAGWQRAAANYGNTFAQATARFIEALLKAAEISPDQHVLDVACGPGDLAAAASARGA